MANIMSQLKLQNNPSRNGFDLSRKNAFTAKVGELLPVACIECIPGHKVKAKVQHFTRTMPVNTAAYTRIREYFDWFFVPTNLLWNKFNTFVTQMTDNNQHATSITSSQVLTNQHPYFTSNQLATDIFSLKKAWDNRESYPNNLTMRDIFGGPRWLQRAKLLQYLGYGDYTKVKDETGSTLNYFNFYRKNLNLNPFPLLTYQKIYQDYFRDSQWEKAYAPAFNIDYISGSPESLNIPITQVDAVNTETMLDLRYASWNKDLFMGVLPNSQYGLASVVPLMDDAVGVENTQEKYAANVIVPQYSYNAIALSDGGQRQLKVISVNGMRANAFSILQLRQAEALQKWSEITQSRQQDYRDQIKAHFGVTPDNATSERCMFIDGSVSNLDISEVTNTNLADDNAADIAGRGVGVGDGSMNFSSDVHGYLMCIYHAVPLLDYAIDGVKRMNTKTMVTDYAIPEFDKTGMVQVPLVELTNSAQNSAFTAELLGYAPRYYDYKTAVDEVHGAFINGGLGAWVAPIDQSYISKYLNSRSTSLNSLSYQWFKVNPAVLNPIFAASVDGTTGTDQLLINASFDIKAVCNLDRNGLPY